GAAVNVLARQMSARVVVADLGVATPLAQAAGAKSLPVGEGTANVPRGPGVATPLAEAAGLKSPRIGEGTANFPRAPAMSREQAVRAVDAGIALVEDARRDGLDLIGTGEMGIGNTTSASAITAAITGIAAREVTGRGTGVDDAAWERKTHAVE